jgi:hypothetical protein
LLLVVQRDARPPYSEIATETQDGMDDARRRKKTHLERQTLSACSIDRASRSRTNGKFFMAVNFIKNERTWPRFPKACPVQRMFWMFLPDVRFIWSLLASVAHT